jgi:hypothetical protein
MIRAVIFVGLNADHHAVLPGVVPPHRVLHAVGEHVVLAHGPGAREAAGEQEVSPRMVAVLTPCPGHRAAPHSVNDIREVGQRVEEIRSTGDHRIGGGLGGVFEVTVHAVSVAGAAARSLDVARQERRAANGEVARGFSGRDQRPRSIDPVEHRIG